MKYGQERTWRKTKGIEPRNRDLSSNVDLNTLQTKFLYIALLFHFLLSLFTFHLHHDLSHLHQRSPKDAFITALVTPEAEHEHSQCCEHLHKDAA